MIGSGMLRHPDLCCQSLHYLAWLLVKFYLVLVLFEGMSEGLCLTTSYGYPSCILRILRAEPKFPVRL